MENLKRKRDIWTDDEVSAMLETIKERHILQLLDSKTKRNKNIYAEVEKELHAKKIYKSGDQIRSKFKYLKCDYYKLKRNNNKSGAQRQTSQHYEILDEMLSHRPALTAEGVDTSAAEGATGELYLDVELDNLIPMQSGQLTAVASSAEDNEEPSTSTAASTSTSNLQPSPKPPPHFRSSFKATKKNSYEKVVQAFTTEWKNTQDEVLQKMKVLDDKNWEALREHRLETERILERDRLETARLLQAFMPQMPQQMTSSYWPSQPPYVPLNTQSYGLSPPSTNEDDK